MVTFLALVAGTPASAETGTVSIRVTTAESLWTVSHDHTVDSAMRWDQVLNGKQADFDYGAAYVAKNDYFEIMFVTPTWATNPTNVIYFGHVLIEPAR